MTQVNEALDKLIEAVEAGEATSPQFWEVTGRNSFNAMDAYNGSLDAAKALHEALLPGWEYAIYSPTDSYNLHQVQLETTHLRSVFGDQISGESDNPARAWLLAILKAYRTQVQG